MSASISSKARLAGWVLALCPFLAVSAPVAQQSYPTAEGASQALFQAVQSGDPQALRRVLGGPDELFAGADEAGGRFEREQFAQKFRQMHRLARQADGSLVLYVGAENWPFPLPILQQDGAWHFDADAGLREVLYRRIGENEYTAIDLCNALSGRAQSGTAEHGMDSVNDPLNSLLDRVRATADTGKAIRFHGYEFQVLKRGDNRLITVAWPAEYRSSGVVTFIVSPEGTLFQKDLGAHTAQVVHQPIRLRLDGSWRRVEAG